MFIVKKEKEIKANRTYGRWACMRRGLSHVTVKLCSDIYQLSRVEIRTTGFDKRAIISHRKCLRATHNKRGKLLQRAS